MSKITGIFEGFFDSLLDGIYDFKYLGDFFNDKFADMAENVSIASIWDGIVSVINSVPVLFTALFLLLALVEVFFGKKVIAFQKFAACAIVGYCVGVTFVAPLLAAGPDAIFPNMPLQTAEYISGGAIALVAAVLSNFVYATGYIVVSGYVGFILLCSDKYLSFLGKDIAGQPVAGLILAVVLIFAAIMLRKYIEIAGTSLLGGFFISKTVIYRIADYRELDFLGEYGWIAELSLILVIGIIGFIVQYKTRRRY